MRRDGRVPRVQNRSVSNAAARPDSARGTPGSFVEQASPGFGGAWTLRPPRCPRPGPRRQSRRSCLPNGGDVPCSTSTRRRQRVRQRRGIDRRVESRGRGSPGLRPGNAAFPADRVPVNGRLARRSGGGARRAGMPPDNRPLASGSVGGTRPRQSGPGPGPRAVVTRGFIPPIGPPYRWRIGPVGTGRPGRSITKAVHVRRGRV